MQVDTRERRLVDLLIELFEDDALRHVWLLQNWQALERLLPEPADPVAGALYLTLGWSQCLTTATWPGTDRWRACLGGPPPAHWWPRSHWHLCWLVHRPDPDHHAALDAALAEGKADRELGLLARSLRAVILD